MYLFLGSSELWPGYDVPYNDNNVALRWNKPCSEVRRNMPPFDVRISVYDDLNPNEDQWYVIRIPYDRMIVDGSHYAYGESTCFVPIHPHNKEGFSNDNNIIMKHTIFFGSHMMAGETLIFDNSLVNEHGESGA
jgi:hypothetical protein